MTALEVHTTHEPSSCTISVIGPVIACNIVKLRDHMHALFARTPALNAYLDLGCCTYIDLDGLFFLANVRDELARAGGTMRLVHTPPLIVRLLRQHNFDDLIDTDRTIKSMGKPKDRRQRPHLAKGPSPGTIRTKERLHDLVTGSTEAESGPVEPLRCTLPLQLWRARTPVHTTVPIHLSSVEARSDQIVTRNLRPGFGIGESYPRSSRRARRDLGRHRIVQQTQVVVHAEDRVLARGSWSYGLPDPWFVDS